MSAHIDFDDLYARLLARIDVRAPDECWPWKLKPSEFGYARYAYKFATWGERKRKGRSSAEGAYRFMWVAANRQLAPKGMVVMHSCDNRMCCNPAHLSLATQSENMKDCARKGRRSPNSRAKHGEENHGAKLTTADVLRIRREKLTAQQIQVEYGISPSHAYALRAGTFWPHVRPN